MIDIGLLRLPRKILFQNLDQIISHVLDHRETSLLLPIRYQDNEIMQLQSFWSSYLRNLKPEQSKLLPIEINGVVVKINHWLHANTNLIT